MWKSPDVTLEKTIVNGSIEYCFSEEDTQEWIRSYRATCLLCHEFEPGKKFPIPTH